MIRLFRLASTNRQTPVLTLHHLAVRHCRQHICHIGNVDLAVKRGLETNHVADGVRVRLHRSLAELGEHGLDRLVLVLELLGDLAQRIEGLRGAVDELGDLHGCVAFRGCFEVRNRDLLVQRPGQILDIGDGVVVRLVRLTVERRLETRDVAHAVRMRLRRLAVEGRLETAHVANRVRVLGRRRQTEVIAQRLKCVVQPLDVGRLVLVVLVGLAVEGFADAGDVVDVADLGDNQIAQREHVALVRDAGVDDDFAAVAVVEGHAQRARVDLGGALAVDKRHQTVERASHTATSRRSRCRGSQRDGVALDRLGCDVADVDKQRSH